MVISVPATSANMGPGFDTLGIALNIRNIVKIKRSKFFSVSIKGEGEKNPRLKGNNIFISIFNDYYKNLTGKIDKFRFTFYNNIPLSRGLGSSSAVIVSAIAAAYEAAGVSISKQKILNLALQYEPHPDNITPAVMGGFNVAVVEKDKIYSLKKEMPSSVNAVVVIPKRSISTAHSRTRLPKFYSKDDAVFNLSRSSLLVSAMFSEQWDLLKIASKDRMHQNIRMKSMPILFEVQKTALENGALMSTLSGSGSTFFNMVHESDSKRVENVLKKRFPEFEVRAVAFDNTGLIIEN
ncbi:homoserine kinase [Nitrosophilus alvini]|uniref:homoserine kinase n=1 Tax=Nitrosophilus alvini TaxID=2714855 RepID=UPI001909CCBE|nr:homoserine kinase [Nitrosophilus alvini]